MNRIYAMLALATAAMCMSANEITDVISSSTLAIPETYVEQEAKLNSTAVYSITLKDEGNGPQFKAGSSGIVSKVSGGKVKRIEVAWGSKSNEDVLVYGQNTPYAASNTTIGGTELGTIEFSAGTTVALDVTGDWEYIGITTTAKKGKAAQVGSISITWEVAGETPEEPCEGVIINEVCGNDGTKDGTEDWIELYNPTSKSLDLSGVKIQKTDEDGVAELLYTIEDGFTLAPDAYYVIEKGSHFTSGISNNKNLTVVLYSPLDKRLDMFDKVSALTHNGSHPKGGSYSLNTDGAWVSTYVSTKGKANITYTEPEVVNTWFEPVTASTLKDGINVIAVNLEYGYVMSYKWNTTKDGSVYLYGYDIIEAKDGNKVMLNMYDSPAAEAKLVDGGDGSWAIKFGDTNNYLNDSRYMACTAFKNIDFKKNDDPAKGTRATISFNADGDAEINFGEGGVLKFNYKDDGTSRFFNYDPADKPEEHLAVYLYTRSTESGIVDINTAENAAPIYYNMQGIQVPQPTSGLYIKRTGNHATKVIIE